jgi:class 3 adenylate cyclase
MEACPACGALLPEDAITCPQCGAVPGQHKLVTVMFCDVVNSSGLTRQLGAVGTQHYMGRFQQVVAEVLQSHGGSVGHRRGDGIMTVFGIPVVHDDDALRAVRAAAQLRQALDELRSEVQEQYGLLFQVRLGINSGTALVSAGKAIEEQVISDAANFAKRLEEKAQPDGILLGVETYKLVRDAVKVEDVRLQIEEGGVVQEVPAYRMLEAPRGPARPHPAGRSGSSRVRSRSP